MGIIIIAMDTGELYDRNIKLLKDLDIGFKECDHEPVLSYEAAAKVRNQFGLTGVESKNLFLKTKDGRYCLIITIEGKTADFDRMKELLGSKVSVASQEELTEKTIEIETKDIIKILDSVENRIISI